MGPMPDRRPETPVHADVRPHVATLVFLVPHDPPVDFLKKYFVSELIAAGFRIRYWNVGPVMNYNLPIKAPTSDGLMSCTLVRDKRHLQNLVRQEKDPTTVFVPQITPSLESRPIFRLLQKSKVKTAFFGRGYLPLVSEPKRQRGLTLNILATSRDKLSFIKRMARALLYRSLPPLQPLDLIFTAGLLAEQLHAKDAKSFVRIQQFDIDTTRNEYENVKNELLGS